MLFSSYRPIYRHVCCFLLLVLFIVISTFFLSTIRLNMYYFLLFGDLLSYRLLPLDDSPSYLLPSSKFFFVVSASFFPAVHRDACYFLHLDPFVNMSYASFFSSYL